MAGCRDRRKAIDVICMSHGKSFDSVPCDALIKAFRMFSLKQGLRSWWPLPPALSPSPDRTQERPKNKKKTFPGRMGHGIDTELEVRRIFLNF